VERLLKTGYVIASVDEAFVTIGIAPLHVRR
jgi:hypothetical protein